MATFRKRGSGYQVLWKEPVVIRHEDGSEGRRWKQKSRTVKTRTLARKLVTEVEAAGAMGKRWEDSREKPVTLLRTAVLAFTKAVVDAGAPKATQQFRSSMMGSFLDFIDARDEDAPGAETPVSELSLTLLEQYAESLPCVGRQTQTRYRKVLEVEKMWAWAADRPERFPGVPRPRRYTGGMAAADRLSPPPPVVAVAAPTWADVDKLITALKIPWHKRVGTLMRFTGLRASQACGLAWHDVDLDRALLVVRSRVRGAKASRSRVVPLSPHLVEEMGTWGEREGLVFPRRYRGKDGRIPTEPYRGDALAQPFRRAWERTDVARERWDVPDPSLGERGHGSPTHCIRRCIRTELIRSGVQEAVVLYLVGQSQGLTGAAYVPEGSPEESPYWPRLVKAVALIPAVGEAVSETTDA